MKRLASPRRLPLVPTGILALGLAACRGADLVTQDGLALRLDDATGAVQAIEVAGKALPLSQGSAGGLSVREWRYARPAAAKTIASVDFETARGWQPVASANWQSGEPVATELRTDGGALGSRSYVRLGVGQKYGHGVGFATALPVAAGGTYAISWQARVPSATATYIVYLRLYDATGREITTESPPPKDWTYSPYTNTHFQYLIGAPANGGWSQIRRAYRVPDRVASLRLALCLWRGDYVDADSLEIAEAPGARPGTAIAVAGPVTRAADGNGCRQSLTVPGQQLAFDVSYRPAANHLRIEFTVRDTDTPPRERAIELRYSLPLQADGWTWHDDIRRQRRIAGPATYGNDFSYEGHAVSRYPFSCVSSAAAALAVAVPLDCPVMEHRSYRPEAGLGLAVDLGLSPLTRGNGPGQATFTFVLFATEPHWGFRAAAGKYYDIFPDFFRRRAQREGCWLWPVPPDEIPRPEDFGLTFWESTGGKPPARDAARREGIYILSYIEPCGLRQWFPELKSGPTMYSYSECLARLKALAADAASAAKWSGGPQREVAQAILNSLPEPADGIAPYTQSKAYGAWAQWWFTNPSPHLPVPNRGTTCRQYEIAPAMPVADGIYVDSVGLETFHYENYRPEHLAAARTPLTFSFETGRPCLPGVLSFYDYMVWMADDLHAQDKLVMTNIGAEPPAYRFVAHLSDVLGSEVGSGGNPKNRNLAQVETDEVCCLRRTYAFRRPTTNLLQEGCYTTPVPALSRAEVEQYIKHQLFYGFYPGVSTIGGEEKPGYSAWKRYFRRPEQFERDRDLFQKYIPVIRRLNAAGWEPVTAARADAPGLAIERFGHWGNGDLLFTLRNPGSDRVATTVRVESPAGGTGTEDTTRLVVTEILSGQRLPLKGPAADRALVVEVAVEPHDTLVLSLRGSAPSAGPR